MPSVRYEYDDVWTETDSVGDETRTREYAPVAVRTRKWRRLDDTTYRLWLRIAVTDFGDRLLADEVGDTVEPPAWYDAAAAEEVAALVTDIRDGSLSPSVVGNAVVGDASAAVEAVDRVDDGLHATLTLDAPTLPAIAQLSGFRAVFDPRGER